MKFNLKKKKKMHPEDEKKLQRQVTANEFINLRDVRGNLLYTKDNRIFAYLRIQPLSLELLSDREKKARIAAFAAEFSNEKSAYKLFSITRPIDVSGLIYHLSLLKDECTDRYRKNLLSSEIADINKFALSGEITERQFYMALWREAKETNAATELLRKVNEIVQRFTACNLQVDICKENDIIKFLNLFANPAYAHMEDSSIEDFIPFIT